MKFLADKLKSDDFRVRTNAALALGASNEDGAVTPLCGALADSSEVVRQASAVALKRLSRSSALSCLRGRESSESNDGVKVQITRAIEAIVANGGGDAPANDDKVKENPNAKYYVSISTIANSTGRAQPEVEAIVLRAIKQKLEGSGDIQIAPSKETPDAAKGTMQKRKMKGFYLAVAVDRFDYSNGNLRVKVKIGVFTYPGKSLLGNVDRTLTKEGVSGSDKSSEDDLMAMAAGIATEQFTQNASAFL
ncbi:HEAT repeat domain-containing protein [Labilithrix luteola]|uniref:HEAT repeat domain-containing protein n=1 Tax=Labilithrix luteola TaxID=1391654 RepID=UPI0014752E52|nr:HEAT repeat domain-containing protein [Labilithrix luteola]